MDLRNQVKHLLRMCGHAFLSTLHDRLDVLERQTQNASFPETQSALLQASIHTVEKLHALTDHVVVETDDHRFNHPDLALMEFLYSYLPNHTAMVPEYADALRAAGYETRQRDEDDLALLKIEGVPEATQELCAQVVVMEFRNRIDQVPSMRERGYRWHIVLHRVVDGPFGFFANYSQVPPKSSGCVLFFRNYAVFAQAQAWCSAALVRTYFKPASSKNSTTESMPRE